MKLIETDHYKIYIGENMYDNNKLFDIMDNQTIFFHLKDFSSSHVYLCSNEKIYIKNLDFEIIDKCCKLVKKHSSRNKNNTAMVMYCEKKNLKKGNQIGEVEIIKEKNVFYYIAEKD